jgi:hypothetical protein
MARSLVDFISSFNTDLARPNRFEVLIPNPPAGIPDFGNFTERLTFRCENADLPSRTFATTEQKFGSAPVEKYPYQTSYNETNLTFIVSDDMLERKFFDGWLNLINPTNTYNFAYRDTYATSITVRQFNLMNDITYSVELFNAYPVTVNQLDLDWSSDGHHKLTVVIAYTHWLTMEIASPSAPVPQFVI